MSALQRPGAARFRQPGGTYELGVKIRVDQTQELTSIRFYKASSETGS